MYMRQEKQSWELTVSPKHVIQLPEDLLNLYDIKSGDVLRIAEVKNDDETFKGADFTILVIWNN